MADPIARGPILIVAAHPDDEALGCGATAARHAAEGGTVETVFVAEGVGARLIGPTGPSPDDDIAIRRRQAGEAAGILGTRPPRFLGLPDNRLDSLDLLDVVQRLEAVIADVAPAVIYTHHGGDLNIDHRVVHQAVLTACRPLPGTSVRTIYGFEVPSSTEWTADSGQAFRPTRFVDVARTLDHKLDALRCYKSEMRDFPHPRSIDNLRALAQVRGASAGMHAAEAFTVIRERV